MGLRYIEVGKLEQLFTQYAIPYTNVFDELTLVSPEDVVKEMSILDLKMIMDSRDDVVATQIWTREDIHAALRAVRMQPDAKAVLGGIVPEDVTFVDKVAEEVKPALENCTDNWDRIHAVIRECMKEDKK